MLLSCPKEGGGRHCSAGARMVANIGSYGTGRYSRGTLPGPSALVMAYAGRSQFSSLDPATLPS